MKLSFDIRGNLQPYEIIKVGLDEFQEYFVKSFESDSSRHEIFEKYLVYLQDLQKIIEGDFFQWIDGSFVSTKFAPRDIDLLTVIHYKDYEKNVKEIENRFASFNARKIYQVDAYVMADYPDSHSKHVFTQTDLLYWKNLFGQTRVSRSKKQFPKGFIQINFLKDGK